MNPGSKHPRLARVRVAALSVGLAATGCGNLIGLSSLGIRSDGSEGPADGSAAAGSVGDAGGEANCFDEGGACYACAPTTTPQFLNACTSATCVPFDDVDRLTMLLPDGALPPLPAPVVAGDD